MSAPHRPTTRTRLVVALALGLLAVAALRSVELAPVASREHGPATIAVSAQRAAGAHAPQVSGLVGLVVAALVVGRRWCRLTPAGRELAPARVWSSIRRRGPPTLHR